MGSIHFKIIFGFLLFYLAGAAAFGGETVKVGAWQNPPEVYMTSEGRIAGIFPELTEDMAAGRGWDIEYVFRTEAECRDLLESGGIDLMFDTAPPDRDTTRFIYSSEKAFADWGTAYSRTDKPVESFLDLENLTIAVMKGSVYADGNRGIRTMMARLDVPCRFIEADSYRHVMLLVDSKQADAGIVSRLFGALNSGDYDVAPTPILFNPRELRFSADGDSERGRRLIEEIDFALGEARKNPLSSYYGILNHYLGGAEEWAGEKGIPAGNVELSADEQRWIEEHPRIRFGVDPEFAPFEILSPEGEYSGISADFLDLVSRETGLAFDLVTRGSWAETVKAVRDHEIDVLPGIGYSEERTRFLAYSEPYQKFSRVIVTSLDSEIGGIGDLAGKRVGVQIDSSHHAFVNEKTDLEPILYDTYEECLLALSRGELDGVIGNLAVTTHVIQNLALTNVKMAAYADREPQSLAFGVRSDWPELTAIINRVLDSVTLKERNAILAKWLPLPKAASEGIDLTREEREWLLMHPRIRVGWDPSWAPVEFADSDEQPRGISMEYLQEVEEILGVEFDLGGPEEWQTTYGKLQNRDLDMVSCLTITPERLETLDFTEPYISSPVVIFGRDEFPYIRSISEIGDLRVVVVENYATDEWLSRDFPDLELIRTATVADALGLLNRGKADLFIGSVLPGNYYLSKHLYRNIKIVGETPYVYKLRMAVREDWPLLAEILDKALASLPEVDRTAFYRKWVWIKYEHGFDYLLFGKIVLAVLLVLLVFIYWNRRLAREVRARKEAQTALESREKALRASYDDLKNLEEQKDNLTHMIVHDIRSPLMSITGVLDLMEEDGVTSLIDMARAEAQRVTDMAQSLLDISRLESGHMPINPVDTDLKEIIETAFRTMEIQAGLAGVNLLFTGENFPVKADRDIISRVVMNLIGNGVKASAEGMTVEVRTLAKDDWIIVEVRDSGQGIPENFRQDLFEKFTTARTGAGRKASVGLGLTFCKLAVEAHGGKIIVESEEGRGSTFSVFLPGKI